MIATGARAPSFTLEDQFGKPFDLGRALRGGNVLLLFYPRDFTPTCSQEVPELDALAERFRVEAGTRVAAISADSRFCHAAWGASRGGIEIPILADVNPYGGVARTYGAWIPNEDIPDRATVIIDRGGVVRYAVSVGKDGRRDLDQLLAIATRINQGAGAAAAAPTGRGAGRKPTVYLSATCGHCEHVRQAIKNLHVEGKVRVIEVNNNPSGYNELARAMGGAPRTPAMATPDQGLILGAPMMIDYLQKL